MNHDIGEREIISYSLTEAAQLTGLSRRSLEVYISSARLKSKKIGGRRIILRKDLLAFVSCDQPFAAPSKKADGQ